MLSLYHLATTLLTLGQLANATLLTREQRARCDSQPGADILALHEQLAKGEQHLTRRDAGELISLDAWVHVVTTTYARNGSWPTKEQIAEEMKLLNNAYAPSNLTFNLVNTTWTKNTTWAMYPKLYEKDLKTKLHRGTSRTLNLYYVPGLRTGGVCRFPNMNAFEGEALAMDGCMVGSQSLPGGARATGGRTTVHEVGHWFGLLHTFQGGCNENGGDFIADTPAEASPANDSPDWAKCPVGRDTCPDLPGLDPIDNHMDYTYYKCRNRFTPGQTARMRGLLSLVRLGSLNKREID
ncbi:metalloprotease [Pochonia chlamydosporia 170]|uniref:Metalloprotease n=1 Tax=Pochonia chlamydosporia 170 TaxID=1380566 RepID=A0A179EXK6_METCM|nr:metalloprotease [Pochonia chlamydosporia 170]OAQ57583.1 metalloprotease [Pochonia chlamydosporia 170]